MQLLHVGGGGSRMYGGRVAMGKEVQREEGGDMQIGESNKDNERR